MSTLWVSLVLLEMTGGCGCGAGGVGGAGFDGAVAGGVAAMDRLQPPPATEICDGYGSAAAGAVPSESLMLIPAELLNV